MCQVYMLHGEAKQRRVDYDYSTLQTKELNVDNNYLFCAYSAFNLEEPLLCFVVNKYVLCSEKVTIVAI